jgi:tRNA A37 N6-isopentenylltransferase MiaA
MAVKKLRRTLRRGRAAFLTGGILLYVEELKRGTNPAKGGRPKDIFKMASRTILPAG